MPHDDYTRQMGLEDRSVLLQAAERTACSALGRVLTSFQHLQHTLTEIGGFFLDPTNYQVGVIVTSELSFRGLLNLVYSLAQHRGVAKERISSLRDILADCLQAEQRRNTLIHSYWAPEPESLRTTRFKYTAKFPKGYKHQIEDITEASLLGFAAKIRELCLDLTELMDAHCDSWCKNSTFPDLQDPTSSLLPRNLTSEHRSQAER